MMLLDTHSWVWLVTGDEQLSVEARMAAIDASNSKTLYLSPISLWELSLKHSRGLLDLDRPVRPWMQDAISSIGAQLVNISVEIACSCAELPVAFHGDPADRILSATARTHGLTLITHDKKLLALARNGYFKALAT